MGVLIMEKLDLKDYTEMIKFLQSLEKIRKMDPSRPVHVSLQKEIGYDKKIKKTLEIILTTTRCPFRCLMCGYYKDTIPDSPDPEQIIQQVEKAIKKFPEFEQVKIFNSGNFFDKKAIPPDVQVRLFKMLEDADLVTIENRAEYVNERALDEFKSRVNVPIEVAMGLEIADRNKLDIINKHMNLEKFAESARLLRKFGFKSKAYILVKPPFTNEKSALELGLKTIDFAEEIGINTITLIPTRVMDRTMAILRDKGYFSPPSEELMHVLAVEALKRAFERVFVDVDFRWRNPDLKRVNVTQELKDDPYIRKKLDARIKQDKTRDTNDPEEAKRILSELVEGILKKRLQRKLEKGKKEKKQSDGS